MKKIFFCLAMLFLVTLSSEVFAADAIASAGGSGGAMLMVLCNVLKFVTGGVGKTLAAFVIIGVGLGFFSGKVSWGLLIAVTLGLSAMFGAPALIAAVTGKGGSGTSGAFCNY